MRRINHELLSQFASRGLTINKGVAIGARLIQSASHLFRTEKLKEEKKRRQTPQGKQDKKGNPPKSSRDLESDWMKKNGIPHFDLKEHASVETLYGFVLVMEVTPASHHDSPISHSISLAAAIPETPSKKCTPTRDSAVKMIGTSSIETKSPTAL